jgi:hypothetical protein
VTKRLAWMLGTGARLLPPGRRQWAEAVGAEAGEVAAGWPRLCWLAGGLWLVAREAQMVRKFVYWLGVEAVAAAAAWVVWLSWRTYTAADPLTVTDRVRVAVGASALVVLPWVGRRRGWFGPVGGSITARLVRVAGCAAVCGLGVAVVRMDSHLFLGPHGPGPFSLPREIAALVAGGAALAALAVARARWPEADPSVLWAVAEMAGVVIFVVVPLQALAIVYVAGVLAATSRRSPVANASLAVGTITGLAAGLATGLAVYEAAGDDSYAFLLVLGMIATVFLLAALAGAAAAWLLSGTGNPQELRAVRVRQGLLAGSVAGAVCGLLLTNFFILAGLVMLGIGPLAGLGGGVLGGAVAADHPRTSRPDHSWAAGLFVPRS